MIDTNMSEQLVNEGDYARLYSEAQAKIQSLEGQLKATQKNTLIPPAHNSSKGAAERARRQVGEAAWSKMTTAQRIESVGGDPATDRNLLLQLFGRGADARLVSDFSRTNPARYNLLREIAIASSTYGAKN